MLQQLFDGYWLTKIILLLSFQACSCWICKPWTSGHTLLCVCVWLSLCVFVCVGRCMQMIDFFLRERMYFYIIYFFHNWMKGVTINTTEKYQRRWYSVEKWKGLQLILVDGRKSVYSEGYSQESKVNHTSKTQSRLFVSCKQLTFLFHM